MAQLNLIPHRSIGIYHFASSKMLQVEASDLGLRPGHAWEQLYDDACDVGIAIQSHRTNEVSRWYLTNTVRDSEGDIVKWVFAPCSETTRQLPTLKGYTLHIIND